MTIHFNPWIGCTKVAPGCEHCYAEAIATRFHKAAWGPHGTRVKTSDANWRKPIVWNRNCDKKNFVECPECGFRRFLTDDLLETFCGECGFPEGHTARPRVFCASLADVFEEWEGPIVDHKGDRLWRYFDEHSTAPERNGSYVTLAGSNELLHHEPATMADLRRDLFALIDQTPNLDWLLLTKRPENVRRMWPCVPGCMAPHNTASYTACADRGRYHKRENVWLLTSIATQADAERNLPHLLGCRDLVPVLGVSCEPLLGPVDMTRVVVHAGSMESQPRGSTYDALSGRSYWINGEPLFLNSLGRGPTIGWVIIGAESGPHARPMELDWARRLVDQCRDAGVAVFVKQLCQRGRKIPFDDWPEDLRVREYPSPVGATP